MQLIRKAIQYGNYVKGDKSIYAIIVSFGLGFTMDSILPPSSRL